LENLAGLSDYLSRFSKAVIYVYLRRVTVQFRQLLIVGLDGRSKGRAPLEAWSTPTITLSDPPKSIPNAQNQEVTSGHPDEKSR
jgi:hypothetical protein